jgi:deoxyribodipyrimidine photolyase-related protein
VTAARTLTFVAPWEASGAVARVPPTPRDDVVVLFVESVGKGRALPWHRKKLVLVLSAMHHFADQLRRRGYRVELRQAASYADGIVDAARALDTPRVLATAGREWEMAEELHAAAGRLAADGRQLMRKEDRAFLATRAEFAAWARGRTELRMEWFYREMRRKHRVLLEPDGRPTGGAWNFDADNRKPWPRGRAVPAPTGVAPDALTQAVMDRVARWRDRWGAVDGFDLPVTRRDAQRLLARFVAERLPEFGPYEDAMQRGAADLLHSTLSSALNVGLLHPLECVRAAEAAYRAGAAPLESVEGFIRQILGWREYVRGVYWHLMPGLRTANALDHRRSLPIWYWAPDGEPYDGAAHAACDLACLADTVRLVRDHGRVHHIPRLMVQANIATLLGVEPAALSRWFWAAFTDAYEWVELPNVMGMATWGDGGVMASKPYVASGAYIDRMSDYCGGCRYDVRRRHGDDACPVNALYWDFLDRHRARFADHPRMAMMIRTLDRFPAAERAAIRATAAAVIARVPFERRPPGFPFPAGPIGDDA